MENEIWKDISEYEGLYQVSNLGRIKRFFKYGKEHLLKPYSSSDGYLLVELYKNNIGKYFLVHRLVAMSFIPNPNKLPEINHKDENKANNFVSNLEWCDRKYNVNYGTHNQRCYEKVSKKVDQFTLDGNFVKTWPSISQIQRDLGIYNGSIRKCCQGKYKQTRGFVWKYHQVQYEN